MHYKNTNLAFDLSTLVSCRADSVRLRRDRVAHGSGSFPVLGRADTLYIMAIGGPHPCGAKRGFWCGVLELLATK